MSAGFDRSTFISPFPGILCVENVPGTFLGVLSSGRLFPEAVWRATGMTGNLGGLTIHLPWMCHGFVFDLTLCIHVCIFVFLIWSSNLWKTCLFFNTYILFFFYKKCYLTPCWPDASERLYVLSEWCDPPLWICSKDAFSHLWGFSRCFSLVVLVSRVLSCLCCPLSLFSLLSHQLLLRSSGQNPDRELDEVLAISAGGNRTCLGNSGC